MDDSISQSNRLFSFESPLGDSLLCNAFNGTEAISELFHFDLELVSEDFNLNWQALLNRNVTVGIRLSDGSFRYFNGFIIRFEPIKQEGRLGYYKAEMVPWLWFLTQTQNCQIYQEKTVVQVIKATFDKAGFSGQYDLSKLGDRHVKWINCCQYRETAFDFISRLAEIEGIYYYFKHEQGKHTLIMVDHLSAHLPLPFQPVIKYAHDEGGGALRGEDTVSDSSMHKVVKPSKYAHKDYNFLIPNSNLYHEGDVHTEVAGDRVLEIYDYPGEYEWPKDAPDWGTLRQQELEYDHAVMKGTSVSRAMSPGYRFDLLNHPRQDLDGNYLLTSVTHHAHEGSFGAGFDSHPASYDNGFLAIPSSVQYRPTRKTETPNIASIQTARVVGPAGEEIYTDEYGRVKVHFHWDREAPSENSSCWIRVMQTWAGPNWGQIWIPRVGMEVMVQFLEGDPDRPVITGCLYNEENRPPYKLPDRKNWSGIMSRSTKSGQVTEYNELRFDDTKGSELHLLHAQKDMQITVNNDTIESIKRDRTLNVKRNQIEQVEADKHGTVKGNRNEKIGGNLSQTVGGNIAVNASGDIVLKAQGNVCIIAGGIINLTAGGGVTISGGGGFGGMLSGVAGGALAGALGGVPSMPGGGVPGLPSGVTGAASGAMAGATGGLSGMTDGLTDAASGLASDAEGALSDATSGLADAAGGLGSGLPDGLGDQINDAVTGAVNSSLAGVTGVGSGLPVDPTALSGQITSAVNNLIGSAIAGAGGAPINPAVLSSQITSLVSNLVGSSLAGSTGGAGGGPPVDPAALSSQITSAINNRVSSSLAGGAGVGGAGGGGSVDPGDTADSPAGGAGTAGSTSHGGSFTDPSGDGFPGSGAPAGSTSPGGGFASPSVGGGFTGSGAPAGTGSVGGGFTDPSVGGGLPGSAGPPGSGSLGGGFTDPSVGGGFPGSGAPAGSGSPGGGFTDAVTGGALGGMPGGMGGDAANALAGGMAGGMPGGMSGGGLGSPSGFAGALSGGGSGGGLPGPGSCFIAVNSQGIILQGSPMIYLNCNMPPPSGTCTHTPVTPTLPDLSKLAPSTNLGGGADPKIAAMLQPDAPGGSDSNDAADSMNAVLGDTGGALTGELQDESEGMLSGLASNPWVNPSSLSGLSLPNAASLARSALSSLAPLESGLNLPGVNVPSVPTILDTVTQPPQTQPPAGNQPEDEDTGTDPEGSPW